MSFSSIAVQQREKEAKALKSFVAFSLIGSLALHIGVLASGIGNLLSRVPSEEEPIEFTIVEPTTLETPEAPEETKKETPKPELIDNKILSAKATTNSNNTEVLPVPKPVEKQPIPQPTAPVQSFKPEPVKEPPKQVVQQPATTPNPRPNPTIAKNTSPAPASVQNNVNQSSEKLRQLLNEARDSNGGGGGGGGGGGSTVATTTGNGTGTIVTGGSGTGTGTGSGSGTGSGTGSGSGSGSGSGTGSGTGSGNGSGTGSGNGTGRRQRQTIATAPTPPKLQTGSGDGRAACRKCDVKYSEDARRRGIEGRVEVAVDTDSQGNVTNVRIVKSSGNRKLDEEHLNQARNWKLKPSQRGRQGEVIATEYAIRGSRRYRDVKKRQRQREEQQRNQQATSDSSVNSANVAQPTTRRRRRLTPGTIVDVPPETRVRQRQNTSPSQQTTSQPTTPVRRLRRQRVQTPSPTTNQTTPTPRQRRQQVTPNNPTPATQSPRRRRRQQNPTPASSNGQTQLRQSLRRFKQQSAPAPVPAPPPASSSQQ
ncbi:MULTISPECIES: energy transducer TonB [Fischerella]|uniref:energy transducer TonB n=1 Tax=Fischerella TaxID=1190 RepID=UPI0002EA0E22|nr:MULTISPECIES: energy transducer TonB [Fischerella]MBD2430863.1 TonB family protein [Fischerella sp. FACHB-380]